MTSRKFARKDRMLAGYRVVYRPEHFHHTLNKKGYNGYVYEHRYVMERHLDRPLGRDEIVHHIDGDKLNNDISNLQLLTRSSHQRIHSLELGKRTADSWKCEMCGKTISRGASLCVQCRNKKLRENRPSLEQLKNDLKTMPFVKVGSKYGVSSNSIRKWLAAYGLSKEEISSMSWYKQNPPVAQLDRATDF